MHRDLLIGLSSIIILGVGAQVLASRMRIPAILLLLVFGLLVGPIAQATLGQKLIDPDAIFGQLLLPIISLSVAVVLFEGGLTLNINELRQVGSTVIKLVTIGALTTWFITSLAARYLLHMPTPLAVLLGAILSVTGPTVIGPLLRHVRPTGQAGRVLKWEGIVIDPIGALVALLVFEGIELPANAQHMAATVAISVIKTLAVGSLVGAVAALAVVFLFRRVWVADHLQSPVALMAVIAAFAIANNIQDESGLFAVTLMGIALASQRLVPFKHILEFKENLSILLVSSLFIILGSGLKMEQLHIFSVSLAAFIAVLFLIARPLSEFLSTAGSSMKARERWFVALLAPRGIVAASVASVFAIRLTAHGTPGADRLVPVTCAVIISTVTVYGLGARTTARLLRLTGGGGFLLAGANPLAQTIALALQKENVQVVMVDTNTTNVAAARMAGVPTHALSATSERVLEHIEGTGIGQLLAVTPNEEVNSLATLHFARHFGRSAVYQLSPARDVKREKERVSHELHGQGSFRTRNHLRKSRSAHRSRRGRHAAHQ